MYKKSIFARDFFYSFLGIFIMNCVLQFLVYPYISKSIGESEFGVLITLLSIVSIVSITFGSSANYARVISHSENKDCNGDYNIFLLISSIIISLISIAILTIFNKISFFSYIVFTSLMLLTNIRVYADVNFRFETNYKYYFFYNLCISIGYIIGILLFSKFKNYYIVFLLGEVLPLIFIKKNGTIFNKPYFSKGEYFKKNTKTIWILVSANFIEALINNIDKIIILLFIGNKEVTIFYLATLLGKSIALITVPLNSVIIGHIVKVKEGIKKRNLLTIFLICIILIILTEIFTYIASYVVIKLLYSNVFDNVKQYIIIGNLGQILNFVTCMILVVLLKFISQKYQLIINLVQLVLYFVIVIPSSIFWGINGILWAILIVNLAKFLLTFGVGFYNLKNE